MKTIKKILKTIVVVFLAVVIMLFISSAYDVYKADKEYSERHDELYREENIEENNSSDNDKLVDEDRSEPLVVDTYIESDWSNYIFVYDNEYLDKALPNKVSARDVKRAIERNNNISSQYKALMNEFTDAVYEKYPDADYRVFFENLKTLEVVECTKNELALAALALNAYGTYVRSENKIYVLKGNVYEKGSWAYQVIFHEFGHCFRTGMYVSDKKKIRVQIEGQNYSNVVTPESLNTIFSLTLFNNKTKDVAYRLQTHYHQIMLECMDNYSIGDYLNHSVSYFAKKLDETNGNNNYASVILEFMQQQFDDYHSDSINHPKEYYRPIYKYISDMYYRKNISSGMSYQEAKAVTDELVDRITVDVPEAYDIDVGYFYEYLDTYLAENNLL